MGPSAGVMDPRVAARSRTYIGHGQASLETLGGEALMKTFAKCVQRMTRNARVEEVNEFNDDLRE